MSLYIEDESNITLPIEVESIANLVVEAALDYIQCPFEAEVNPESEYRIQGNCCTYRCIVFSNVRICKSR